MSTKLQEVANRFHIAFLDDLYMGEDCYLLVPDDAIGAGLLRTIGLTNCGGAYPVSDQQVDEVIDYLARINKLKAFL
jgi:hypothetical protein